MEVVNPQCAKTTFMNDLKTDHDAVSLLIRSIDSHVQDALKSRVPLLKALKRHHRIEYFAERREFKRRCQEQPSELLNDGECIVGCKRTDKKTL